MSRGFCTQHLHSINSVFVRKEELLIGERHQNRCGNPYHSRYLVWDEKACMDRCQRSLKRLYGEKSS